MRDLQAPLAELNQCYGGQFYGRQFYGGQFYGGLDCGAWPLLGECAASAKQGISI